MAYTVHQAKTNFSRILKEVEAGQEVIVMRGKKPVARIVAVEESKKAEVPFRLLGAFRGKIKYDDSLFAPLTDEQLAEYGFDDLLEGDLVEPSEKK
jgi:prevent-host-death family protein